MKKNHIKNNLIYYRSVIDLAVTGFKCHIIHFVKREIAAKEQKYSLEEISEEIRVIAKEN